MYLNLEHFSNEYHALLNKKSISKRRELITLNVMLFDDNLIRVRGKLAASNFSFDTKHPVTLLNKSLFIKLYVK